MKNNNSTEVLASALAKSTRREMIARTTRFAAALTFGSALAPLLADPAGRGFKIGAPEWSLRKTDPSCFEVAKEIGLDGVQVNLGSVGDQMHLRQPEVQQSYLQAARQNGLVIASLALAELNNIPLKSDPRAALWLLDSLAVAQALGVKVILV
ncbi:MAG TPA: hypothetical protein VK731_03185, partial [Candidatus Cybelea sp.]|nr:hypothetical protein [Candidatus Cybelea sp.]